MDNLTMIDVFESFDVELHDLLDEVRLTRCRVDCFGQDEAQLINIHAAPAKDTNNSVSLREGHQLVTSASSSKMR